MSAGGKQILLKIWKWSKRIFMGLFIAQLFYIILLKWVNPPITMTQLSSWITGHGLKRDYVGRNSISKNIKLAVIASEDQLFPDHHGFDWKSIKKAMAYNQRKPGRITWRQYDQSTGSEKCFLMAGKELDKKRIGNVFHVHDRIDLGKEKDPGSLFECDRNGRRTIWD